MLYRVIRRTTGSVQPTGTFWQNKVLYCGYDRDEARRVYHESEPTDYGGSCGNQAAETAMQVIADKQSDDFNEDVMGEVSCD